MGGAGDDADAGGGLGREREDTLALEEPRPLLRGVLKRASTGGVLRRRSDLRRTLSCHAAQPSWLANSSRDSFSGPCAQEEGAALDDACSAREGAGAPPLLPVNEAVRWFQATDLYASMRSRVRGGVQRIPYCRHKVTGRRRLGGYLFSLLLFISVSQRQSNIETIPLAALRLGGSRLFGWGICLSSICCIPIIIADIALGQAAQGSAFSALEGLHRRLRGVALAMGLSCLLMELASSYSAGLLLPVMASFSGAAPPWMPSPELQRACRELSDAECHASSKCVIGAASDCLASREKAVRVYWVGLLTASPEGSKVGAIVSCLTMWAIVGYLVTKGPRMIGAMATNFVPLILIVVPAFFFLSLNSREQRYSVTDIFSLPPSPSLSGDLLSLVLLVPLMVYMPGDGVFLTLASYNARRHSAVVTAVAAFVAKWLVAFALLAIVVLAEGLAPNAQHFEAVFLSRWTLWDSISPPMTSSFPVILYLVAGAWPTSWILGVLFFVSVWCQRVTYASASASVIWAIVTDSSWIRFDRRGVQFGEEEMQRQLLSGLAVSDAPSMRACSLPLRSGAVATLEGRASVLRSKSAFQVFSVKGLPNSTAEEGADRGQQPPEAEENAFSKSAFWGRLPRSVSCAELTLGGSSPRGRCSLPSNSAVAERTGVVEYFRLETTATASAAAACACSASPRNSSERPGEKKGGGVRGALRRRWRRRPDAHPDGRVPTAKPTSGFAGFSRGGQGTRFSSAFTGAAFSEERADNKDLLVWVAAAKQDEKAGLAVPLPNAFEEKTQDGAVVSSAFLAVLIFGPVAFLSLVFLCISLPIRIEQGAAPPTFHVVIIAELLVKLHIALVKCVYLGWISGSGAQTARVGRLPVALLHLGFLSVGFVPLVPRFQQDATKAFAWILGLPLAATAAAVTLVGIKTTIKMREMLRSPRGWRLLPGKTAAFARGTSASPSAAAAFKRADARTFSCSLACGWGLSASLHSEEGCCSSARERRLQWCKRRAAADARGKVLGGGGRGSVLRLYLRLLRSDLYWLLIGNVELARASLNMALYGEASQPLPFLWSWLFKFVATPWLFLTAVALSQRCVPQLIQGLSLIHPFASAFISISVAVVVLVVILGESRRRLRRISCQAKAALRRARRLRLQFVGKSESEKEREWGVRAGIVSPECFERLRAPWPISFPLCWVPKVSFSLRPRWLDEINPFVLGW